jgi:hypothetical protein
MAGEASRIRESERAAAEGLTSRVERSAIPPSAWMALGFALLFLAAAGKFLFVDHFVLPLPYLLPSAALCLGWVARCWLRRG